MATTFQIQDDVLHIVLTLFWEWNEAIYFPFTYELIVVQIGFFNLGMATNPEKGKLNLIFHFALLRLEKWQCVLS